MKKAGILTSILVAMLLVLGLVVPVAAQVELPPVNAELAPGESITITKEVTTSPIPPEVDTGSDAAGTGTGGTGSGADGAAASKRRAGTGGVHYHHQRSDNVTHSTRG